VQVHPRLLRRAGSTLRAGRDAVDCAHFQVTCGPAGRLKREAGDA